MLGDYLNTSRCISTAVCIGAQVPVSDALSRQVALRILSLRRGDTEDWKDFASRVGLSPSQIGNWRGGGGASLDAAATVLENHEPRLRPAWLLAGERPKYLRAGESAARGAQREAEEFSDRLRLVERVARGEMPPEAIRRLVQGSPEAILDALADLIGPASEEA